MNKNKNIKSKSGSALILTTILLFVILGMVVSLTYVTVMEQKMSGKTKSSVTSFYNAESGIEWVLNKIASNSGTNISSTFGTQWDSANSLVNCPDSFGDNECKIYLLDQDGNVIQNSTTALSEVKAVRSVGTQGQETQRAIEAAVAQSTSACSGFPTEISDEQSAATLIVATTYCRNSMGDCWHLPSLEELTNFLGYESDDSYLLTTSWWGVRSYSMIRLSDGRTDNLNVEPPGPSLPFRCVK